MRYKVNFAPEFRVWWNEQTRNLQKAVLKKVDLLEEKGPHLARPDADTLEDSKLSNLKELCVQYKGDPTVFYMSLTLSEKQLCWLVVTKLATKSSTRK